MDVFDDVSIKVSLWSNTHTNTLLHSEIYPTAPASLFLRPYFILHTSLTNTTTYKSATNIEIHRAYFVWNFSEELGLRTSLRSSLLIQKQPLTDVLWKWSELFRKI